MALFQNGQFAAPMNNAFAGFGQPAPVQDFSAFASFAQAGPAQPQPPQMQVPAPQQQQFQQFAQLQQPAVQQIQNALGMMQAPPQYQQAPQVQMQAAPQPQFQQQALQQFQQGPSQQQFQEGQMQQLQQMMPQKPAEKPAEKPVVYFGDLTHATLGLFCWGFPSGFKGMSSGQQYLSLQHHLVLMLAATQGDEKTKQALLAYQFKGPIIQGGAINWPVVMQTEKDIDELMAAITYTNQSNLLSWLETTLMQGLAYKFLQNNPQFLEILLSTGDSILVAAFANPIFGIGFTEERTRQVPTTQWGKNLLGLMMMRFRDHIRVHGKGAFPWAYTQQPATVPVPAVSSVRPEAVQLTQEPPKEVAPAVVVEKGKEELVLEPAVNIMAPVPEVVITSFPAQVETPVVPVAVAEVQPVPAAAPVPVAQPTAEIEKVEVVVSVPVAEQPKVEIPVESVQLAPPAVEAATPAPVAANLAAMFGAPAAPAAAPVLANLMADF